MTRRRMFTSDFKARAVLEELTGVKSTAQICREHQLNPQVLSRWKAEFLARAPEIFATKQCRSEEQERIAGPWPVTARKSITSTRGSSIHPEASGG